MVAPNMAVNYLDLEAHNFFLFVHLRVYYANKSFCWTQ